MTGKDLPVRSLIAPRDPSVRYLALWFRDGWLNIRNSGCWAIACLRLLLTSRLSARDEIWSTWIGIWFGVGNSNSVASVSSWWTEADVWFATKWPELVPSWQFLDWFPISLCPLLKLLLWVRNPDDESDMKVEPDSVLLNRLLDRWSIGLLIDTICCVGCWCCSWCLGCKPAVSDVAGSMRWLFTVPDDDKLKLLIPSLFSMAVFRFVLLFEKLDAW